MVARALEHVCVCVCVCVRARALKFVESIKIPKYSLVTKNLQGAVSLLH
jgi:hypothetical protein